MTSKQTSKMRYMKIQIKSPCKYKTSLWKCQLSSNNQNILDYFPWTISVIKQQICLLPSKIQL